LPTRGCAFATLVDVQAPAHRVRRRQARRLLSLLDMQTGPHKLHELRRVRPASVALSLQTVIGTVGLLAGCGLDAEPELETGQIASAATVSSFIKSSCSTSVVVGLSTQVAQEVSCLNPSALTRFSATNGITFSSNAVLPFLAANARTDLQAVGSVQLNSAFRTVPQQFLLLEWFNQGRCGITAAAAVGRSNHESGRAVDLANASSRITAMSNHHWSHDVSGDPPHFDHLTSADIRGKDTLAFQRLWNRNNPSDKISEDGDYGPQTEARLKKSPATGFAKGASCAASARVEISEVVAIDGPDRVAPGSVAHYQITVANRSETDWPATTTLAIAGGAASELYDAASWVSNAEIGAIGTAVPAGGLGTIDLDVVAPSVTEVTPVGAELVLVDGTVQVGSVSLVLTVTPNGDEGTSSDSDDQVDGLDAEPTSGGCSAGGGAGILALAPALMLLLRRRR